MLTLGFTLEVNQADRFVWMVSGDVVLLLRPGFEVALESDLAAVNLVRHEPEFRARYAELTDKGRAHRLAPKQAYVALANKLLRTLWSMATSGRGYDPAIARGEVRPLPRAA